MIDDDDDDFEPEQPPICTDCGGDLCGLCGTCHACDEERARIMRDN